MSLRLAPITLKAASGYISAFHRHHIPPQGWKFGIAAKEGDRLVGVVVVGRPVARGWDQQTVCEVTRLCTDGTRNACSFLYGAARRAAAAMGYKLIVTYILDSEPGTSLKASGWSFVRMTAGGSWDRSSRPRKDKAPTVPKQLWEAKL
jgi:hypothetical protein